MDHQPIPVKTCKLAKWILASILRFPIIDYKEIEAKIVHPGDPSDEVSEYLAVSTKRSGGISLAILTYFSLFVVRYAYSFIHLGSVSGSLNYVLERNIVEYACLATNCSRLSTAGSLKQQLLGLPTCVICHSKWISFFWSPYVNLVPLSVLLNCICCLYMVAANVCLPLSQISLKAGSELMMFIVAPKITSRMFLDKIRNIKLTIEASIINYKQFQDPSFKIKLIQHKATFANERTAMRREWPVVDMINKENQLNICNEYFEDCLPAVRTEWWRLKAASIHYYLQCLFLFLQVSVGGFIVVHLERYVDLVYQMILEFSQYMRSVGCTIWLRDDPAKRPIDLDQVDIFWNSFSLPDVLIAVTLTVNLIGAIFFSMYIIMCELITWRRELIRHIMLSIEFTRLMDCITLGSQAKITSFGAHTKYRMAHMRDQFISDTSYGLFYMITKNLGSHNHQVGLERVQTRQAYRRWALTILAQEGPMHLVETQVIMVEKLYISLRLFMGIVDMYSPNVAVIILFVNFATYGMTAIAIFLNSKFKNHHSGYSYLISFLVISQFAIVGAVANFHAKARQLQMLLWTLVAELAHSREVRINHMRSLFMKQAHSIDRQGGIALNALNFKVTYVNVAQVSAFSATLLGLAIRR